MRNLIILTITILLASCTRMNLATPKDVTGTYQINDLQIEFNDGLIAGITECNTMHGTYVINNDIISMHITTSKVGCDEFNPLNLSGDSELIISNTYITIINKFGLFELYRNN